ncbi:MAG: adenosine kinase [Caldithrix sp.]|nr:adenosine kinase [Caldithrix sp.]
MSQPLAKDIVGVGSPIIDMNTFVEDRFLETIDGEKGGMELVDKSVIDALLNAIEDRPVRKPGGASANTIFALARLGSPTSFLGMIGGDEDADFYRNAYTAVGGNSRLFKTAADAPTARCLNLITPDSERTMRTDLGAAAKLNPRVITADDFKDARHVHIEGYLLFNRELMTHVLQTAKEAGCTISYDLGSFEVVRSAMDILPQLLRDYIDMVFGNEEEVAEFCNHDDPHLAVRELGKLCRIAAVKRGRDGALICADDAVYNVQAVPVANPIDTTGAGDYWGAGFLYGYYKGYDMERCGRMASIVSSEVVRHIGSALPEDSWSRIKEEINQIQ